MAEKKRKRGRPRVEIDKNIFEGLCKIQCTCEEIGDVVGYSHDGVESWCKRTYGENFSVVSKRLAAHGKSSLRRWMFKGAKNGNASLLIWLSKQHLGMSDQPIPEREDDDYSVIPTMTLDD